VSPPVWAKHHKALSRAIFKVWRLSGRPWPIKDADTLDGLSLAVIAELAQHGLKITKEER